MCVDKLFYTSMKDFDKHFPAEDYLFIQDQKGPCKNTFANEKQSVAEQELLRKTLDTFLHVSSASTETSSLKINPSSPDFEEHLLSSRYKAH